MIIAKYMPMPEEGAYVDSGPMYVVLFENFSYIYVVACVFYFGMDY